MRVEEEEEEVTFGEGVGGEVLDDRVDGVVGSQEDHRSTHRTSIVVVQCPAQAITD